MTYSHAYSILDTFQLKDEAGNAAESLYLVKDPNGPAAITDYKLAWNNRDTTRWTKNYRLQVQIAYAFDPVDQEFYKQNGIFFVPYYNV